MKTACARAIVVSFVLSAATPLFATFDVTLDVALDNQTASAPCAFSLEFVATATTETPDTISADFDKGSLDISSLGIGDVIGTWDFPLTALTLKLSMSGEFEVTAVNASSVEGDVVITSLDPLLTTLLGLMAGDVLFTFAFTDNGSDSGATFELLASGVLPGTTGSPVDGTLTIDMDPIYVHTPVSGDLTVDLTAISSLGTEVAASEVFAITVGAEPMFARGDASGDGVVNALLDALFILNYQFSAGPVPPCIAAADVDGNGTFNALVDALFLLTYQFSAGPAPPDPGPSGCGPDPNGVECAAPGSC